MAQKVIEFKVDEALVACARQMILATGSARLLKNFEDQLPKIFGTTQQIIVLEPDE